MEKTNYIILNTVQQNMKIPIDMSYLAVRSSGVKDSFLVAAAKNVENYNIR